MGLIGLNELNNINVGGALSDGGGGHTIEKLYQMLLLMLKVNHVSTTLQQSFNWRSKFHGDSETEDLSRSKLQIKQTMTKSKQKPLVMKMEVCLGGSVETLTLSNNPSCRAKLGRERE
ncbi:hypothetical protein C5167_026084 [Papaver somniferum]|nr:hypothetical protein C5167_026084 [Papaver somniferum]